MRERHHGQKSCNNTAPLVHMWQLTQLPEKRELQKGTSDWDSLHVANAPSATMCGPQSKDKSVRGHRSTDESLGSVGIVAHDTAGAQFPWGANR